VADDIITFGAAGHGPGSGQLSADERFELLFQAGYPQLVRTGYLLTGGWDLAEQLAQDAYLRLWRRTRWRWLKDPRDVSTYLQRTVMNASRQTIRRRVIDRRVLKVGRAKPPPPVAADPADFAEYCASGPDGRGGGDWELASTDLERQQETLPPVLDHEVDTGRGWRELQALRSRASRNRGALAVAGLAAAVAIAFTVPALSGGPTAVTRATAPVNRSGSTPAAVRTFPRAIVASIPVSGVIDIVQDGTQVWAISAPIQAGASAYRLVGIDLRADKITLQMAIGSAPRVVAAGDGEVWLTTAQGSAGGQVVRIDPATGKIIATLHLAAGQCDYVTFSSGRLWAQCGSGRTNSVLLRINPITGQVQRRLGPVRGPVGQSLVGPSGAWYLTGYSGISEEIGTGGGAHAFANLDSTTISAGFAYAQSLVYGQGSLWTLTNDEHVAKINPGTGHIERLYTAASYDPAGAGGLNVLTVGQGSLWFLDDGYPFSGVLRVSMVTGRPLDGVTIPAGACGSSACSQIYDIGGRIWVPTMTALLEIDPARLPA
jgi:DNA-directed RNA polymerase specialized sigma24 family protein/streptogramin lyase